ncbi:MAG: prepilin-type N-terminal cleavage/methylation domain-containing protein [Desulfobacteraceae bacterium]|nr:MAG: prepilin-type N-terminal cleavage/methylation domain-containing protein [Desulfobacteraceae bacterium]
MPIDPSIQTPGARGFTLLEVLVATFILAIVMGLIFGTFEGVFSNADHVNASSDSYEMADSCLKRISLDLQSMHVMQPPRYQIPDADSEPDIYRIEGKTESIGGGTFARLRFTSLGHLPIGGEQHEGIAEIVYYIQDTGNDTYVLRRSDKLYPYPESFEPKESDPILCDQVRAFKLVYFDKDNREQEEWDSEDDDFEYSTPKTIAVHLTVGSETAAYQFASEIALPVHRFISQKR